MTEWQNRELASAQELAKRGSELLRQNNFENAEHLFNEVDALLDMSPDSARTPQQQEATLRLRAQLYNELGVLHQRKNDVATSRDYHRRSIDICNALREAGVEFRANSAATHLNLSSVLAAADELDEARELGQTAVALIEELRAEDNKEIDSLALGAYQNMSLLYARLADFDAAAEQMEASLKIVDELVEAGEKRALPQAAQTAQRLSVMQFEAGEHQRALTWGKKAETLAEAAYEALGKDVLSIYVVSQINLISYNQQLGYFADAEDALWKGLEVSSNHVDILRRGLAFYDDIRKQADGRLEEGNLPREEVEDGRNDLLAIIEKIGGLPEPSAPA